MSFVCRPFWLALALLCAGTALVAQPARLIKDIYPGSTPFVGYNPSDPSDFVVAGGYAYFTAKSETDGRELWRTDGTTAGTTLVRGFSPGQSDSNPKLLAALGNEVLFGMGTGVWRSDGTPEGTVLVREISYPYGNVVFGGDANAVAIGSMVYFTAVDSSHGIELWRTDGTAAGTILVKDIEPGPGDSNPVLLANVNGTLFFFRRFFSSILDLWKSDGTEAGTTLVKSFSGIYLTDPVALNGKLVFAQCDGSGCGLWSSDGSSAGTVKFSNQNAPLLFPAGAVAYFGAGSSGPAELWRTDGTAGGTVLIKDIHSGPLWGTPPYEFAELGGLLFFTADDGAYPTRGELWKSDGTAAGTTKVFELPESFPTPFTQPVAAGPAVFFVMGRQGVIYELWKSGGTGATLVKVLADGTSYSQAIAPDRLARFGDLLLLSADDGTHGKEPWRSDGTAAGTFLLRDVDRSPNSSNPVFFAEVNDRLFFSANDGVHGEEFWKSDGREEGTLLVKDIADDPLGNRNGRPGDFIDLNGVTIFTAFDREHGRELWKTDGTGPGTTLLKDINPTNWSHAGPFVRWEGSVLFGAFDGAVSTLWKTDGTEGGTAPLLENGPAPLSGGDIERFVEFAGALYFLALSPDTGHFGLWRTDASAAGTQLVKTLNPYDPNQFPLELIKSNGRLFFVASDASGEYQLWKSNGTEAGTVPLDAPESSYLRPWNLTDLNGTLFFSAFDGEGYELWKSDGTSLGTKRIKSISTDLVWGSQPVSLTAVGTLLYFAAEDSEHGWELWKSDGTEAGTLLVEDINPGPVGSYAQHLTRVGDILLFAASDPTYGMELWRSDGSQGGTTIFQDIHPGPGSSQVPSYWRWGRVGSRLYLPASNGEAGYELWSLPDAMVTGTAISPTAGSASGGTTVAVSGWNLVEGTSLTIGGLAGADTALGSPAYVTALAPAFAPGTLHDVVLTNPGNAPVTIPKGWFANFADVPTEHAFHDAIERIFRSGLTSGCGNGGFCPEGAVTRAALAILLLKAKHGSSYRPPKAKGNVFTDVPADAFGADWIEQLAAEGITKGCGTKLFCPNAVVTREQMAAFLLRAKNPVGYLPPDPTGLFSDVVISNPLARWIEQLAREGISRGCGGDRFCPADPNTRGQMAAFLTKTFPIP